MKNEFAGFNSLTKDEYHAAPGVSSTQLMAFYKSTNHANAQGDFAGSVYTDGGCAFEDFVELVAGWLEVSTDELLEERIEWAINQADLQFREAYAFPDGLGEMPNEVRECHNSGGDLDGLRVWTKKKELSLSHSRRHGWIDFLLDYPGKKYLAADTYESIKTQTANMMAMDVEIPLPDGRFVIVGCDELLANGQFQQKVQWRNSDGIICKCMFDVIATVEHAGTVYVVPLDLKRFSGLDKFRRDLSSGYWIQSQHYNKGLVHKLRQEGAGNEVAAVDRMIFLVASALPADLNLCQGRYIDDRAVEEGNEAVDQLVSDYDTWRKLGRPSRGWIETEETRVWIKGAR